MECRLAAALLARKLGATPAQAAAVRTLRQAEPWIIAGRFGPTGPGGGNEGQLAAVAELLESGEYSQEQVESDLGLPLTQLFQNEPAPLRVLRAVKPGGFRLRDRARHVYSEAARVHAFRAAAEVRGCFGSGIDELLACWLGAADV